MVKKGKETRLGWDYNSHIVCMCIIMRWSRNYSASWAERFWTSLLCTYKLCDYCSPIPILSPFLFIPSLYALILNLQDFSFTCLISSCICSCLQNMLLKFEHGSDGVSTWSNMLAVSCYVQKYVSSQCNVLCAEVYTFPL